MTKTEIFKREIAQCIADGLLLIGISITEAGTSSWLWGKIKNGKEVTCATALDIANADCKEMARCVRNIYYEIGCLEDVPECIEVIMKDQRQREGDEVLRQLGGLQ